VQIAWADMEAMIEITPTATKPIGKSPFLAPSPTIYASHKEEKPAETQACSSISAA
jgi:hypothetical protein